MQSGRDLADLKERLIANVEAVARALAPNGWKSGNYWVAKNPARNDDHAGSFWIALRGAPGAWRDEATGEKGDVISLIAHCQGTDVRGALVWARDWLNVQPPVPAGIAPHRKTAEEDEAQLLRQRKFAHRTWLNAAPSLEGTVAETYLAGRGILLSALPRQPRAMRFAAEQPHYESKRSWPAIVAAMTGPGGEFLAIHRTFLQPDGSAKGPDPCRKMWPRFRGTGAAVHLWRGETELPVREAHKQGLWDRLALVEGIEDGLSVAVACPELRVWCAGSLANLADIRLPACAGEVIVFADNDWGKREAEKLFEKAIDNLSSQGVPVKVTRSPIGKDVNDALRGAA